VELVGRAAVGDEVVVNTQARDLALGSGGFDVVHVNLTSGLEGEGVNGAHVMKLNYSSLQHAIHPVEAQESSFELGRPVGVFGLHGQLAPVAFAFAGASGGGRLGYVQTAGAALPGGFSEVARELRERALLAGHLTAGQAYGGADGEAISTAGALQHGFESLGWDAAVCGPGPGILGSGSGFGHGGMAVLDSAHTARALGCPTVVVARMSEGDKRPRHRGVSHHTTTVLRLLLAPVLVGVPDSAGGVELPGEHDVRAVSVDLDAYAASGLPARTMGRTIAEDPVFFAAALAGGTVLGELIRERG
jgi:hypothetical protein